MKWLVGSAVIILLVPAAHSEGLLRGRLWIEWQGPDYYHWAGEVSLSAGKILRGRCRRLTGTPGILKSSKARGASWQTVAGYENGTAESVVFDIEAPNSASIRLRLPKSDFSAPLAALRRKKEFFNGDSTCSIEFRILFPHGRNERITRLKRLYRETPLVKEGKPQAAILAPKALEALARRIQQAIKEHTRVTLPILDAATLTDPDYRLKTNLNRTHNLLLLGDVNSNPVLVRLYANGYVLVDAQFPGDGGYVLRSISDPWGTGRNAFVIGAGDDAGLKSAVDRLLDLPALKSPGPDLILPRMGILKFGKRGSVLPAGLVSSYYFPQYDVLGRRGIRLQPGSPIERNNLHNFLVPFGMLGATYNRTGDEAYARHVKQRLDQLGLVNFLRDHWGEFVAWRNANPDKFHLFFRGVAKGWDLLEESPVFTDADRLAVTNVLWNIMNGMCTRRDKFWLKPGQTEMQKGILMFHSPNHETWSGLALYSLATYFKKYYAQLEEPDYWLELAHAEFAGHETTFEAIEDAKLFQARDTRSCMAYALASGNMGYFRRGMAQSFADLEVVVTDSLGYGSGYGDAGLTVSGVPTDIITRAEWFTRSGEFQWLATHLVKSPTKLPLWARRDPARRPDRFLGIHVIPAYQWAQTNNVHYRSEEWIDYPKARRPGFNKISFRESFHPDGQYLLLDGRRQLAYHAQDDSNSIVRFTDNRRMWIVDAHPSLRGVKHQNAVSYDLDGRGASLGGDAIVRAVADLDQLGFLQSDVPRFGSASWTRSALWHKGDWFVVFDHFNATRPGDYLVRCHWRLRGQPQYDEHGVTLEQKGERFRIHCASPASLQHEDLDMADIWAKAEKSFGYTFAQPICRILHEEQRRVLKTPGPITFANLFYAFNDKEPMDLQLTEVSRSVAWLEGNSRGKKVQALVGVRDPGVQALVSTDATLFCLESNRLAFAHLQSLSFGDRKIIEASQPISFEFNFEQGAGILIAGKPCRVRVYGSEDFHVDGRALDGTSSIEVSAGRFPIRGLSPRAEALRLLFTEAKRRIAAHRTGQQKESDFPLLPAPILWKRQLPGTITAWNHADLNADGRPDLLLGTSEGRAFALSPEDGRTFWTARGNGTVNAIAGTDLTGNGKSEVIVCSRDARCFDQTGKELWKFQPLALGGEGTGRTFGAAFANLKGVSGKVALVAGARLNVFSPEGKLLWYQPPDGLPLPGKWMPHHFVTAADVDGDGFDEALGGVQMSYPFAYAINGQRELVWNFPVPKPTDWRAHRRPVPGRVTLLRCADLTGDGRPEALYAGASGGLRLCFRQGATWREANAAMADEPLDTAVCPANKQRPGLVLASDTAYFIYLFSFTEKKPGKLLWRKRLGHAATAVAIEEATSKLSLLAGTREGQLLLLDYEGRIRGRLGPDLPSRIMHLESDPQACRIIAITRAGQIEARSTAAR